MLNTHSYYSYKYGTVEPSGVLDVLQAYGYEIAVLTDINSTSASLDFVRMAQKRNMRHVLGIDVREGVKQRFIALARNNTGWECLNAWLSELMAKNQAIPERAPDYWGEDVYVIYPLETGVSPDALLPNEYLGVRPAHVNKLAFSPLRYRQEKLLALQTFTFRNKRDFNAHRLLRAIANNTLLSKLPKAEEGSAADLFVTKSQLEQWYASFPALLENAERLAHDCSISFDFGDDAPSQNKRTFTGNGAQDQALIRELCEEGLKYRYPGANALVRERLERELTVITEKGFLAYFLIAWDLLRYARHKNYFYVGRGSGANSMVAYLLRITDVDPIELDLYFERFINLFRKNPPDFDVDFSWRDRQDITRYLFDTHGKAHTALLGAYVTFQYRAVVRELGKVFGLPKHEIDLLASGKMPVSRADQLHKLVLLYGSYIQNFPNYLSIHAGGIIISHKPIHYFTATDLPPKGFATTYFDMVTAEDVGLYKFDILGQRGLGKIKDTLQVVRENRPLESDMDIHDVKRFKQDRRVRELLKTGKAIGCFYVESPAMRMLLTKLGVTDYEGLVAASSIIRPGVSKSGMMREYIKRFRDPGERKNAHPRMLEIMPDTFGVMVYQEDVIKVAHIYAKLTLGEADVLRRGMSGKYRSREEFRQVKQTFFDNCRAEGHPPEEVAEIWRQIESFAGYAFAKGHSASYAVESYQSLFLKAYFPIEYMVATVNNGGGFYRTELYLHEARMNGASIHLPCVNHGAAECTLHGTKIYIGFAFVHGMPDALGNTLVAEREANGAFESLEDFVDRVSVSIDELECLIRVNAFRFTGESKRRLMWKAHGILNPSQRTQPQATLFRPEQRSFALPDLTVTEQEELFDQLELLGFTVNGPWELLQDQTPYPLRAADLPRYKGKTITLQGYLITVKNTGTSNGKTMHFGTFLDRDGEWLDTVHFPPVAKAYPFQGKGVYTLTGTVVEEFGVYSVEVERMRKEPYVPDPRYAEETNKFKRLQREDYVQAKDDVTQEHISYGRSKRMGERMKKLKG